MSMTTPRSQRLQINKQKDHDLEPLNHCDKCNAIDWTRLPMLANDGALEEEPFILRELNESHAELSTSRCEICRFLSIIKPELLDGAECSLKAIPAITAVVDTYEPLYKQSQCTVLSVVPKNGPEESWLNNGCLASLAYEGRSLDVEPRRILPDSIDFDHIKALLSFCDENHSRCFKEESYEISGLRVIDVSTRDVIKAPKDCRYAALSYVWGGSQAVAIDSDLTAPPPVIEDAIQVAKKVGCEYLWVDRYVCIPSNPLYAKLWTKISQCIPQNDRAKHEMIGKMNRVYSHAFLTIIAAAGDNAATGLPGVGQFQRRPQQELHLQDSSLLQIFPHGARTLSSSRWATRGWTFQECCLSKKRLIFTTDQVLFLCDGLYAAESVKQPLARKFLNSSGHRHFHHLIPDVDTVSSLSNLQRQIEEYSKRHLSYAEDSLDALLGVFNHHSSWERTHGRSEGRILHLWGIPIEAWVDPDVLHLYLEWKHENTAERRPAFPSWSWAGWAGAVRFINTEIILRSTKTSHSYDIVMETGNGEKLTVPAFVKKKLNKKAESKENKLRPSPRHPRIFRFQNLRIPEKQQAMDPKRLLVTAPIVSIRVETLDLSEDDKNTATTVFLGSRNPNTAHNRRRASGRMAVFEVLEGIYGGVSPYFDVAVDLKEGMIGLVLDHTGEVGHNYGHQTILIIRQTHGDDTYERIGLIEVRHGIVGGIAPPMLYMDAQRNVLDEVLVPFWDEEAKPPFLRKVEKRTICLV